MSIHRKLTALVAAASLAGAGIAAAGDPPPAASAAAPLPAGAMPDESHAPIHRTTPIFPREALTKGISGAVVVEVDVDATGKPSAVRVIESTPPGVFDKTTVDCVSQWRWAPYAVGGVAKPRTIRQKLEFKLAPD